MPEIIRLCRLYNVPAVKARKANKKKKQKARKVRPAREGIFPVGKTKFFEDYVFRDESEPNIPGTDVPRLRLFDLGPKAKATNSDEISRVTEGLQRRSHTQLALPSTSHAAAVANPQQIVRD
jgi:hypothetical protein